jgi:hypothetical protein
MEVELIEEREKTYNANIRSTLAWCVFWNVSTALIKIVVTVLGLMRMEESSSSGIAGILLMGPDTGAAKTQGGLFNLLNESFLAIALWQLRASFQNILDADLATHEAEDTPPNFTHRQIKAFKNFGADLQGAFSKMAPVFFVVTLGTFIGALQYFRQT